MSHFKTILLQVVICTYLFPLVCAQLSQPIFSDENIDTRGNKFLSRSVGDLRQPKEREEIDLFACPVNVELSWMTEVSSSVYSTPLITDLFSDGAKEIIVPSFVHYLETLEAADGAVASGWPAFHKSSTHASPLLTDIDYDGVQDISIATYDGEVLFFKDNGEEIPDRLYVPRLSVRKNWFKGLNPDHVDHSHPDVNDPNIGAEAALQDAKLRQARVHGVPAPTPAARKRRSSDVQEGAAKEEADQLAAPEQGPNNSSKTQEKPPEDAKGGSQEPADKGAEPGGGSRDQEPSGGSGADSKAGRRPQEEAEPKQPGQAEDAPKPSGTLPAVAAEEPESGLESGSNSSTTVSQQRRRLLDVTAASAENKAELDPEAEESFDVFKDTGDYEEQHLEPDYMDDGHMHDFPYDDDDYYMPFDDESKRRRWGKDFDDMDDMDDFWDDEDFMEGPHGNSPTHVMVDPHILCTPTIADLDGDGHDEMIISVSYFYDREHYDHSDHKMELGDDIDIANYVASGIVVYELHSRTIKWSQHLDLSTDFTKYRAYIYSSPTVADIDRDGSLEIIVGTSVGFLYVLDSKGEPREGWPVQMGEIQGQPLVADVNGDGFLEIFVGDTRGNSALFNYKGHELWERHVGGIIAQMATAGDINGDGELEIVFGTGSGDIHAVNGKTGQEVPNFPFRTGGRVMAPVLIVKLLEGTRAQHLVVSSFDGLLYMVDGLTGCADTIDVGETSYAMVCVPTSPANHRPLGPILHCPAGVTGFRVTVGAPVGGADPRASLARCSRTTSTATAALTSCSPP